MRVEYLRCLNRFRLYDAGSAPGLDASARLGLGFGFYDVLFSNLKIVSVQLAVPSERAFYKPSRLVSRALTVADQIVVGACLLKRTVQWILAADST